MSPLLVLAAFFCLGAGAAFFVHLPWMLVFAVALLLAAVAAACGRLTRVPDGILLLSVLLLGFCRCAACQLPSAASIDGLAGGRRIGVRGIVAGMAQTGVTASLVMEVEEIFYGAAAREGSGKILIRPKGPMPAVDPGDRILVSGELLPCAFAFPSSRERYVRYLATHNVTRVILCHPWEIVREQRHAAGKLRRLLDSLQEGFSRVLETRLSPQSAALMRAMVLGEKNGISPFISKAMINSGTIHILVVSGFNVGIVACLAALVLKLARVPRKARFFILLPCIVLYCLLTGASEPVVRAGVMAAIMSAAVLVGRDGDIQHAFALALCSMVALNPRLLCDASFQLSFASVFALIAVYPAIRSFLGVGRLHPAIVRYIADGLAVSFAAWAGTVGIVAYYFRIVSPGAVFINVLAAPLAGFVTVCGFCLVIADRLAPALAGFIAVTADYAIALLVRIVSVPCWVLSLH